jgi:hypothetical protein
MGSRTPINQVVSLKALHHDNCEFWTDHYPHECTCGATMPRAPWFDEVERRVAAMRSERSAAKAESDQDSP